MRELEREREREREREDWTVRELDTERERTGQQENWTKRIACRGEMGVVGVKYAIGEAATEYWVLLVLAAIGFLYVLRLISLFLPWIYVTFLRPAKPLSRYNTT